MKKIGLIFNGVWSHYAFAKATKYKDLYELVYIYELSEERIAHLQALVIPFQSNQLELSKHKALIYRFLQQGKKVFVEGDSSPDWLDAQWEDRPVNNYWWVKDPHNPPVAETDFTHPIYEGLSPRHSCWHTHGAYTSAPSEARIVQTNADGEIISWETQQYGGSLFATTLDPIVEHGVQQITHLDNYVDKLTTWLCEETPSGKFEIEVKDYGVSTWAN
ncbi:MAG: hypothetical protein AB8H47_22830 [Bacteroidia bacterium]